MKHYKLIWILVLVLFLLVPKGRANSVLNLYTSEPITVDSILHNVMTFTPFYEKIVNDYRADLYIKGKLNIRKKNFMFRYLPKMFRMQKGVREYLMESYSELHSSQYLRSKGKSRLRYCFQWRLPGNDA